MSEELKPCPCCGGEARLKTHYDHLGNWHCKIYCLNHYNKKTEDERCWCELYTSSGESKEDAEKLAIEKWNKRVRED